MNAIIVNFQELQQQHLRKNRQQKEQLINECRHDINQTEEQIRYLAHQIHELQTNIDLNYRLIDKISRQ